MESAFVINHFVIVNINVSVSIWSSFSKFILLMLIFSFPLDGKWPLDWLVNKFVRCKIRLYCWLHLSSLVFDFLFWNQCLGVNTVSASLLFSPLTFSSFALVYRKEVCAAKITVVYSGIFSGIFSTYLPLKWESFRQLQTKHHLPVYCSN